VTREQVWYFVGLDLGQSHDYSALAVVERTLLILDEIDHVTYERLHVRQFRLRFLERVRLGTPYPDVVERVRRLVRGKPLVGRCTLVMDATGVGAPVLDLLRRSSLGCVIEPVILTGGDRQSHTGGIWRVPKPDLVTGLLVMLEKSELRFSKRVAGIEALRKELSCFGARRSDEHDDLVMALALSCWRAGRRQDGIWGTRSLGL
jgi:hypothetical protein